MIDHTGTSQGYTDPMSYAAGEERRGAWRSMFGPEDDIIIVATNAILEAIGS
jgi:hypothetical protein